MTKCKWCMGSGKEPFGHAYGSRTCGDCGGKGKVEDNYYD
jgi:DnaJ-class molecular chaperone